MLSLLGRYFFWFIKFSIACKSKTFAYGDRTVPTRSNRYAILEEKKYTRETNCDDVIIINFADGDDMA